MANFIQYVEENNKIKSIKDIDKDEYLFEYLEIQEASEKYCNYIIGDLILVQKYKYKNGKLGYYHIFLIVDIDINSEDILYFGMLLSSKVEKASYKTNKIIRKNNDNNLRKDSIIKTDAIYKIFTKNILLKIGNIDKTKVEIYKKYLINNI